VGRAVSDVLQSSDRGKQDYLLRYDEEEDEWTLQSGLDGDELRPGIECHRRPCHGGEGRTTN
jgi:hypothetical protein